MMTEVRKVASIENVGRPGGVAEAGSDGRPGDQEN